MAIGLAADRLFGEPQRAHPVALFGRVMRGIERGMEGLGSHDDKRAGLIFASAGVGIGAITGGSIRSTAAAGWLATSGRALGEAAQEVSGALIRDDIDAARALLPSLVGRDVATLDEKGVARAAIESVAENTVDAIVAPALWALAGGARGALGYRACNTLDAMVGHRNDRYINFGWASARLDDGANWIPARATALLVAAARPARARQVWHAVKTQAPLHPSPNSGVAEAAFAAALGLRLGGELSYDGRVELRPHLGNGRAPESEDIPAAVRLSRDVTALLGVALMLPGALLLVKRMRGFATSRRSR